MHKKLFIDTSAWLAVYIPTEKSHLRITRILKEEIDARSVLYTSNYIIDETVTRLLYDTSWDVTKQFLQYLHKSITEHFLVELWVDEQIEADAFSIFTLFKEHKLSLTDATTVVFIRRYKMDAVISLDSDFKKIGLSVLP